MHIHLGISPAWGGGQRLLRLVGYGRALDWLTAGHVLSAKEAFRMGIANRVAPEGESLKDAFDLVATVHKQGGEVIRKIKSILRAGVTRPPQEAEVFKRNTFPDLWAAPAHREAPQRIVSRKEHRTQRAQKPTIRSQFPLLRHYAFTNSPTLSLHSASSRSFNK